MSTGFVLIRFHGVRHPATLGSSEVEAFLSLAGERAQGFGLHASSGIGGLAVLLRQGAVHGSAPLQEIGRPRPSRRLPVVLTLMKWFASSVFWKASIVCSPSFCMERACGSVRVCNCGSRIWISDHGTIIVREGKARVDQALMLPESLAPACASSCRVHGHGG